MKTYKNPISTAMSEYREDFRYNREWWIERMGNGNNNEFLWIQFKNGDNITVQADYFQIDGNTCLPRFRADEVAYISRYFGDQCETTTAADIVVDTDRIILYADGVEYFRYEMSETEYKEMHRQMWELDDETDSTAWMLDYCRALATSKMNNNGNTDNTMKANNTLNISDLANWINFQLSTIIEGVSAGYTLGNNNTVWIDKGATVFTVSLATGEEIEVNSDDYNTAEDIAKAIISILNKNTPTTPGTMNTETKTIITVSITEDGNKCEYTANGNVLAFITYRKEFDKYDVNTPSVGYMTDNVTEAHKACESGINWLLNTSAVFDYSAVERYNTVNYPETV